MALRVATDGAEDPGSTVYVGADGRWPGGDTLTLDVNVQTVDDVGRRSPIREPTRFEMTHVSQDEFDAAC